MPVRALVVLVLLAALFGAPSPASAAGNDLSAPTATPTTGSTSTVFVLAVRYDGKFPALSVTAQVAGRSVGMGLTAGTALAGRWSAAVTLPAGTWPVSFTATVERGNAPTLAGPTVTVNAPSTPAPPPPPPPPPTIVPSLKVAPTPEPGRGVTESSSPTTDGGNAAATSEPGEAAPAATAAATAGTPGGAVAPEGGASPEPAGSAAESARGGDGGQSGGGPASTDRGDAMPAPGATDAEPAAAHADDDGLLLSVLLVGLAGVAAVALIGTAILLAGHRRREDGEEPVTSASQAAAALERRTLRRAHVRLGDDPIVAAMGIGAEAEPRRARRRAGQVGRGPGERPNRSRRT